MPRLSVWAIRAALVYLVLGFTLGGLLLAHKGAPLHPAMWSLLPAHIEFLLFGWTAQLALGVSFWILPRFARPPKRGNVRAAWLAVILLNVGVWLVSLNPWVSATSALALAGRLSEAGAAAAYAVHAWPRIKPLGA